jgi:hypothetical protein
MYVPEQVGDTNQPSHRQLGSVLITATITDVLIWICIDLQTTFKTDLQHMLHDWYQVGAGAVGEDAARSAHFASIARAPSRAHGDEEPGAAAFVSGIPKINTTKVCPRLFWNWLENLICMTPTNPLIFNEINLK